jgi:peptide deformylase
MTLEIVHYNHPVLRKKGEKIAVFDAALRKLAADMIDTMHAAPGIGLAAQQVGRAIQLCVVDLRASDSEYSLTLDGLRKPPELLMPLVLANPVVTPVPGADPEVVEEGCLSFPEIRGDVGRPEAVTVTYNDERGGFHTMTCDGLLARCIQHEVDHLNGVLFIDRMDKKARVAIDAAVKELARATRLEAKAGKPAKPV